MTYDMVAIGVLQQAAKKLELVDYKEQWEVMQAVANGVGIIKDATSYWNGGVVASYCLGRKWYQIVVSSNARVNIYVHPGYRPDNPQYDAADRKIEMEL